jgi:hypothetical protein
MHAATRWVLVALPLALAAAPAAAQEFRPPAAEDYASAGGLQVDLFGFTTRAGIDVTSPTEWVVGSTVDVAELWSPRVRLRPSFEVSSDGTVVRFHWAAELVYRFQPDGAPAIPYLGLGLGHMTRCGGCVTIWPTVVIGFELEFRPSFNWLVEYHALDRLGRHRFLIGLATRGAARGN